MSAPTTAQASPALGTGGFHSVAVSAVEQLTEDAVAITFDVAEELAGAFAFRAGQHLTILGDDGVRRSYSLCDAPESGKHRIGVRRLPGGAFSEGVVAGLAVGDTLEVMAPAGRFSPQATAPDAATGRRCVAIAAGSGITPVRAIVESLLVAEADASVTLIYANRTQRSVMFLDELHDLKDRFPERFQILHVLSREQQQAELLSGRLDETRLKAILAAFVDVENVDEWFLCGPQEMVLEHRTVIQQSGSTGKIHLELFHADPVARRTTAPTPAGGSTVTIRLGGRDSTFDLADDSSVLEAASAVRPDVPFACKGGVCGTCRARVIEGSVTMDANWALEPDEIEAGYVLTCQSHPTSPSVLVDYDG
ncbi:phenylacetate-CoA oxygenase/reductase subunit PaaK [Nocardioides salsibiostraticola]